jgi:hypothetical protein
MMKVNSSTIALILLRFLVAFESRHGPRIILLRYICSTLIHTPRILSVVAFLNTLVETWMSLLHI